MQSSLKNNKGFTLVETLVAITILLLAVTGTITTAQKGLQNAYYATDQVTAVFLAQEAIESIRAYRDSKALEAYANYVSGGTGSLDTTNWLPSNIATGCIIGKCRFNPQSNQPFESCTGSNCVVHRSSDGRYTHNTGDAATKFTRQVYIEETNSGEVKVTVDVKWTTPLFNSEKHVNLTTWIYDHYKHLTI